MADFKAHLSSGIANGACIAGLGYMIKCISPMETGAVFILGTIGALLPDLDSDTGKPLALLFQLLSVLIPIMLYPYARILATPDMPFLLCYFTLFYLFINYFVCSILKKITKHRGIMHSIPFSILCGELAFLMLYPSGLTLAVFGSFAVFSGSLLHLVLDELNSMSIKFGFIVVLKNSSGSALKFFSPYIISTIGTYLLIMLSGTVIASKFIFIPWLTPVTP